MNSSRLKFRLRRGAGIEPDQKRIDMTDRKKTRLAVHGNGTGRVHPHDFGTLEEKTFSEHSNRDCGRDHGEADLQMRPR